jgi:hypothetical protein
MMTTSPASAEITWSTYSPEDALLSSELQNALRIERAELPQLEAPTRQPFERLKAFREGSASRQELEGRTWFPGTEETTQALLSGPELDACTPEQKHAIGAALSRTLPASEPSTSIPASEQEPEADDYLLKTTTLIARRLAEYLNSERLIRQSLETGALEAEHRALSIHMKYVLEENQRLRQALAEAEQALLKQKPGKLRG